MNKLLRYSFVALMAMIGLNISAQEVTLDFTLTDPSDETAKTSVWGFPASSKNKTVEEQSFTYNGYTVKVAGSEGEGYYWHDKDHYLLFGKQGAYLTLPAFNFDVERIDIEGNSSASTGVKQNIFVGDEAVSTETTGAQGTNIFTIAEGKQAAGTIYTIKVNSKHNNQIRTIKIWKKGSGAKQSADIAWSKASATVTIGANDNVFPTLSNPNNLTVSYASTKEEVATINANGQVTLVAAGTTKISAIFEGNDSYEASTVSYNLTVKEAETPSQGTTVANVAALNALEDKTAFTYTSDVLVVYVNGSYAYIKDDTGSSLIYDSSKTKFANLGTGSRITANWTGKVSIYNNLFEAVPDDVLPTAGTSAVLVTYPDAAITDVVAANMNQVVVLKGVTYTAPEGKNFTISQGGVEVKGYNTFGIEIAAPEEGKTYNITGVISVYKENVQFLPIAIEEAGGGDPGIDPSATIYEVPVSKFTPWDGTSIEGNVITMGAGWKGGAIYVGGDMTQFDYVWIKFKNATGTPNFGITYDEWTSNADWGPVFAAVTTAMDGTGMVGIKLDKKTVMVHGNAETGGVGIGDVYAQHVQQITIQGGNSAASVEVEGIWFGTTAEFVKAGGDVPVRPEAGGALTMWEGELVYDGWGVSSTIDPKYFEVAEVGDIIYCSVKDVTADYNPIFKYQDWSDFTDIQATLAKDETHFEGKIATAEALDYLQKNGLRFQGVGFTLTKVELKVPDPSGVNTINAVKVDNGAIYNVAGQKVNAGYKGLVIMNGKKYVNK